MTTVIAFVTRIPGYVFLGIKEKNNEVLADNTGMILAMMVYINSFANLFVYTIRMPRFRQVLLRMLGFGRHNKVNSENGRKNVQVTGRV